MALDQCFQGSLAYFTEDFCISLHLEVLYILTGHIISTLSLQRLRESLFPTPLLESLILSQARDACIAMMSGKPPTATDLTSVVASVWAERQRLMRSHIASLAITQETIVEDVKISKHQQIGNILQKHGYILVLSWDNDSCLRFQCPT